MIRREQDPAELAERYRHDDGAFADAILAHCETVLGPPLNDAAVQVGIRGPLLAAINDAATLDARASEFGERPECRVEKASVQPLFLRNFMASVFCYDGFINALVDFSRIPPDKKAYKPVWDASARGEDLGAAFVIYLVRNKLKDGFPVNWVLGHYADDIAEVLKKGEKAAWLVAQLDEAKRDYHTTPELHKENLGYMAPAQHWVEKAWLPLALWSDDAHSVKAERLESAWKISIAAGVPLPSFPQASEDNPYPVQRLIDAMKAKLRRFHNFTPGYLVEGDS